MAFGNQNAILSSGLEPKNSPVRDVSYVDQACNVLSSQVQEMRHLVDALTERLKPVLGNGSGVGSKTTSSDNAAPAPARSAMVNRIDDQSLAVRASIVQVSRLLDELEI